MENINKRWVLAKRPEGMLEDECWKLEEASINDLDENQVLIKVMYLSIDPYMRGRMNDMKSYTEPVAIGEVMTGESVGQVIQSRSEKFQIGDYVAAHLGWQSFIRCNDDNNRFNDHNDDSANGVREQKERNHNRKRKNKEKKSKSTKNKDK